MTLANAQVNSIFVDKNTTYNGTPIEWVVLGINKAGQGITTLAMVNPITNHCYDAKEPQNPNTSIQSGGNGDYEKSNILQWLNSDKAGGEWYTPQHENDYPPNHENVGGTYASEDGFLRHFSNYLKTSLNNVEMMGVTRKVHLPSYTELNPDTPSKRDDYLNYDDAIVSTGFSLYKFYQSMITSTYPSWSPAIRVRTTPKGTTDSYKADAGLLLYNNKGTSTSSENTQGYKLISKYADIDATNTVYTLPVIYVSNDIPVTYDSATQKYYHDYSTEVEYEDYGSRKGGFSVKIKINTDDTTTSATVKAYVDGSTTTSKTFNVTTFNAFTTLTFTDSDFSSLADGSHTVKLVASQGIDEDDATFTFTKVAESVPIIFTNTVGRVTRAFETVYQVYDEDGDSVNLVIMLDNTQIGSITDAPQNTDITLSVTTSQFNALSYGNHSITIEATDGSNTSTATIAFTKNSIPTVSISNPQIGEVTEPFSVEVTANSADGDAITIKAYIDEQEIQV